MTLGEPSTSAEVETVDDSSGELISADRRRHTCAGASLHLELAGIKVRRSIEQSADMVGVSTTGKGRNTDGYHLRTNEQTHKIQERCKDKSRDLTSLMYGRGRAVVITSLRSVNQAQRKPGLRVRRRPPRHAVPVPARPGPLPLVGRAATTANQTSHAAVTNGTFCSIAPDGLCSPGTCLCRGLRLIDRGWYISKDGSPIAQIKR